jgi:formylglycine-generating enzyme required for sulfatase activity
MKLSDPATGVEFVQVPGGKVDVGYRAGDLAPAIAKEAKASLGKARTITVKPFLVARAPLSRAVIAAVTTDFDAVTDDVVLLSPKVAAAVLKKLGYRLLTDDEWEYVARGGGKNGWDVRGKKHAFGVANLGWGSWVAPAKGTSPKRVRAGGLMTYPWQSDAEIAMVHASFGMDDPRGEWPVLVAWDGTVRAAPKAPPKLKGIAFVEIPGGTFEMGLGKGERKRLQALVPRDLLKAFDAVADACPPRAVTVAPFRCAVKPLSPDQSKSFGGSSDMYFGAAANEAKVAARIAKAQGVRMLTEKEWEFVARDGGKRAWGADLEALLKRAIEGGKPAKMKPNRWGIEELEVPVWVDTGAKTLEVARSIAWSGYKGNAAEILQRAIKDARAKGSSPWRGIRFAT